MYKKNRLYLLWAEKKETSRHLVLLTARRVPDVQTLPNMQGYPYDIWTIKFWTMKFPGDIWIVEIWRVKTNQVRAMVMVRVRVSYDCPVYDCPDFDCAIKTCNQGTTALTFRPMSIVVKRLHGSRCHLVQTMEVRVGPYYIALDGNPAPP